MAECTWSSKLASLELCTRSVCRVTGRGAAVTPSGDRFQNGRDLKVMCVWRVFWSEAALGLAALETSKWWVGIRSTPVLRAQRKEDLNLLTTRASSRMRCMSSGVCLACFSTVTFESHVWSLGSGAESWLRSLVMLRTLTSYPLWFPPWRYRWLSIQLTGYCEGASRPWNTLDNVSHMLEPWVSPTIVLLQSPVALCETYFIPIEEEAVGVPDFQDTICMKTILNTEKWERSNFSFPSLTCTHKHTNIWKTEKSDNMPKTGQKKAMLV